MLREQVSWSQPHRPLTASPPNPTKDREALEAEELVLESAGSGTNTLLGAALLGSGAMIVVGLLGVARTKVLALELEPSGLGLYGQLLTVLTALSAASGLGLGLGTTRVIAEARARRDREGLGLALEVSYAIPLAIATLLALAIAGFSGLLAPLLLNEDLPLLVVLTALAVPMVALQGPLVHSLQGFRDVKGAQGANVSFGVAFTVASVVGVVVAGLDGAVAALAIGNLTYVAVLVWRLRRVITAVGVQVSLAAGLKPERLRQPLVRNMLAIGFASLMVGMASTLGELVVRTIVLKSDGASAAGIVQALQVISVQIVGVIVTSIVFLSFPAVAEARTAGDDGTVRRTIDDTLRLALLMVLPVLAVFVLFRTQMVDLLLSADFGQAADLLPRQLTGDVLRTAAFAIGSALVPAGLTREWTLVTFVTVAAYVGAAALLIEHRGLDGAIEAYVVEWGVCLALTALVLTRNRLLRPSRLTLQTLACGGLLAATALSLPESGWLLSACLVAAFLVILTFAGTERQERTALRMRARAMLSRR